MSHTPSSKTDAIEKEYSFEEYLEHFAPQSQERETRSDDDPAELGRRMVLEAFENLLRKSASK